LSKEAEAKILISVIDKKLTLRDVKSLSLEIYDAQKKRVRRRGSGKSAGLDPDDKSRRYVMLADVENALSSIKSKEESDPLEDLEKMIGLKEVKKFVETLKTLKKKKERDLRRGKTPEKSEGLRMLFLGNPGTGKTVVASIFSRILREMKFTKSEIPWTESDVVASMSIKGADDMVNLFKKYKNSIIFIDEFQDMASTEGGKKALMALNPLLTAPENQGTVVIGAGYRKQVEAMLADEKVQPGLVRRFKDKVLFADYARDELEAIWEMKCKKKNLKTNLEVTKAAIDRAQKEMRAQMQPSNGGQVEAILEKAIGKQSERLDEIEDDEEYNLQELQLLPEDVILPPTETMEDVWKHINSFPGLEDLKKNLRRIENTENAKKARGKESTEQYNIVLQGPAGTGKSFIAKTIIGRFFSALGVIPYSDVEVKKGSEMKAPYEGQTDGVVKKMVQAAYGRTLFIDEISALASWGGDVGFGPEAIKALLPYLSEPEYNRKFVVCIADYPDKIAKLFKMDQGLSRRFPQQLRINLSSWGVQESKNALLTLYNDKMDEDLSSFSAVLEELFGEIVGLKDFSSGGTIIDDIIPRIETLVFENAPTYRVTEQILREAFCAAKSDLGPAKSSDLPPPAPQRHRNGPMPAMEAETQADAKEEEKVENTRAKMILSAMDKMNKKFGDRYNETPALYESDKTDPNSQYNKDLAAQLSTDLEESVTSEQAMKVRIKVARIKKEKVMTLTSTQVERFEYDCPFCERVQSEHCFYFKNSDYSDEWRRENSRRPPWSETVQTEIEEEVDVLVIEDVEV